MSNELKKRKLTVDLTEEVWLALQKLEFGDRKKVINILLKDFLDLYQKSPFEVMFYLESGQLLLGKEQALRNSL